MRGYFTSFIKKIKSLINMQEVAPKLSCPSSVRGMKILDRTKFSQKVDLLVLQVDSKTLSSVQKLFKKYIVKLDNFKPVQTASGSLKYIYLDPDKVRSYESISEDDRKFLETLDIHQEDFLVKMVQFDYVNWKSEHIFKAVLPEDSESVSGFSQIGHIIHLNLRDHLLEYKTLIGEVLIDKVKTCRTVVNKTNIIDNTYRNFQMELLAGENDFFVTVKENNCMFQFDFSKVYWNSRLHKEHERIVKDVIETGDILFDVFAGVGPFAIPALKKKCTVFANDLNPESHKWLLHNAKTNKVLNDFEAFNLDGSEFITNIIKEHLQKLYDGKQVLSESNKIHITMNLPALAVTFLKYFNGLMKYVDSKIELNILVHVYCFVHGENDHVDLAHKLVEENLNCQISDNIVEIVKVRNVAPAKEMMRVSFKLTRDILFGNKSTAESSSEICEPPFKKVCTS